MRLCATTATIVVAISALFTTFAQGTPLGKSPEARSDNDMGDNAASTPLPQAQQTLHLNQLPQPRCRPKR